MRTISAQFFIKTKAEFKKEVFNKLKEIPNIKDAHLSSNTYDIITKVEAESMDELEETISSVRLLKGVIVSDVELFGENDLSLG